MKTDDVHPGFRSPVLYRAPFVVVGDEVVANGCVVVAGGKILYAGRFGGWREGASLVEYDGILVPALINCHAHLELSWLAEIGRRSSDGGGFPDWIRELLEARQQPVPDAEKISAAAQGLREMRRSGCGIGLDIGNIPASAALGSNSEIEVHFYREFLGLKQTSQEDQIRLLARMENPSMGIAAHAPYTTGPGLLQAVKDLCRRRQTLMPVHVAESEEEILFLKNGSGPMGDFLRERDFVDDYFQPPGLGAVAYLDDLQVLDGRTLCVHCVHLTDAEINLLAARGAQVCLCPGSNQRLGVGRAAVEKMLAAGIRPGLGTDSLASNSSLNLWREMALVRQLYPGIAPVTVFNMATSFGAAILGAEEISGSLAAGRQALVLHVGGSGFTSADIFDFLTTAGEAIELDWVCG